MTTHRLLLLLVLGGAACSTAVVGSEAGGERGANLVPGEQLYDVQLLIYQAAALERTCFDATAQGTDLLLYVDRGTDQEQRLITSWSSSPGADMTVYAARRPQDPQGSPARMTAGWHSIYVPGGTDSAGNDTPIVLYMDFHASENPALFEVRRFYVNDAAESGAGAFPNWNTFVVLDGSCP